jgi:hypothetical protein
MYANLVGFCQLSRSVGLLAGSAVHQRSHRILCVLPEMQCSRHNGDDHMDVYLVSRDSLQAVDTEFLFV